MRSSPKRLVRAMARLVVAFATASLVALLSVAVALAPTAPVEALAVDGQSWIPGEIPPEPGDRDPQNGSSPALGGPDGGDDAVIVQRGQAARVVARRADAAPARPRGIRPVLGAGPRGPPEI